MAQIVTITNPLTGQPAQVDQLEHTAQEIDDAIARALPGGDIDTLLDGKAPAGYGLGESKGRDLSNVSLNSLINNGWYYLYRNNTDGPDNVNISDAILFVSSARSDLTKVQRLILGTQGMQGYELRRVYNNKSWLPWEWVNPPMVLGVEYRTTERYLGKPVYAMTVDGLSSEAGAWKQISGFGSNVDELVRYTATGVESTYGEIVPIPSAIGNSYKTEGGVVRATNNKIYIIYKCDKRGLSNVKFTLYYTKTTD